jgi:hypothetical protein
MRHPLQVFAAQFSPDGQNIATTTIGGHVWLWDAASRTPKGRFDEVITDYVTFRPDVAGSFDEGNCGFDLGPHRSCREVHVAHLGRRHAADRPLLRRAEVAVDRVDVGCHDEQVGLELLRQQRADAFGVQRWRHQVALRVVAPHRPHLVQLRLRLHPLGDHRQVQPAGQRGGAEQQRSVLPDELVGA